MESGIFKIIYPIIPNLFLLFQFIFPSVSCSWPFSHKTVHFPPEQESQLEEGDLICRMGIGVWSTMFRDTNRTDKRFSHCGLLVRKDGKWQVIHSSANDLTGMGSVGSETLEKFVSRSTYVAVYRFPYSREERHRITERAEAYRGTLFDTKFDVLHDNRVYCSELVYLCINQAFQREVLKPEKIGEKPQITIDDLYLKTNAKIIIEVKPD